MMSYRGDYPDDVFQIRRGSSSEASVNETESLHMRGLDNLLLFSTEERDVPFPETVDRVRDVIERRENPTSDHIPSAPPHSETRSLGINPRIASISPETAQNGYYREGIRHITRTVSDTGFVAHEKEENYSKEPLEPGMTPGYWLKIITAQTSKQHLLPEKQEVVICDVKLRDLIYRIIRNYIDHTNKTMWQQEEVILKGNAFPILLNYNELEKAAADNLDTSVPPDARHRLSKLLQNCRSQCDNDLIRAIDTSASVQDFRIPWKYVWTLFKPGTLVVSAWDQAEAMQVFKVQDFCIKHDLVSIKAWIWDWSGKDLVRSLFVFHLGKYDGERAPSELVCCPLKFCQNLAPDAEQRRTVFRKFTFEQSSSASLLHYQGDIIGGCDECVSDAALFRYALRRSDSIFEAKLSAVRRLKVHRVDEDIVIDTENYIRRSGGRRWLGNLEPSTAKLCSCALCISAHVKEWIQSLQENAHFPCSENDLLLAPRLTGFALGRKEWCQFFLDRMSVVENSWGGTVLPEHDATGSSFSQLASGSLVLPEDLEAHERDDIYDMVANHSQVMARSPDKRVGDLIGGKGESLILLFHGHSGTGKSLYAECLAKASLRPLFKVGTSDIGLQPAAAERNLKEIFALAEAWNALLLIDEADVLLDARGGANESRLSKNALVSVLLREVEYFKGVLIMTTNRVQAFDPAILTRIHHAVNFEATTQKQESLIWSNWVNLLEERKLTREVQEIRGWLSTMLARKGRTTLSGREIRNVFIQAQSIAVSARNGEVNITARHLERAYEYRQSFRRDTNEQRIESHGLHVQRKNHTGFGMY